jgi:protein-S-isoprenylcysteine O-methyltransferase Ste14
MNPTDPPLRMPLQPPVLFGLALGLGLLAERLRPWPLPPLLPRSLAGALGAGPGLRLGAGALCLGLGGIFGLGGLVALRRHRTSPDFRKGVACLVEDGPYRFSRNPLYVALVLALAGLALVLDSGWVVLAAPLLLAALDRLVVRREEAHLALHFGASYRRYLGRTRRWL